LENRLSVISIIVENTAVAGDVNELLHAFGPYIVGRMGIPYRERGVSIICVVLDAPGDVSSSLSGKLGMIKGVGTKTIVAKGSKQAVEGTAQQACAERGTT
jgi:putative iron-only hydrogenase system regulator